jgi:hypothetical protein
MPSPDSTHRACVRGIAFWAPRAPGWDLAATCFRGETALLEVPSSRPAPSMLASTERRRASDTVAIALEVAARACESAGLCPTTLPSVFACTCGDLAISDYMAATIAREPALVSPTRFHNSVHNAAAGYWTIGAGCSEPYTALSARNATFGSGLLEALTQAACGDRAVLLVAYDVDARGPLATVVESRGLLAAALVVAPSHLPGSLATLDWRLVESDVATPPHSAAGRALEGNGMSGCTPFYEALAARSAARVRLALQPARQLEIDVVPAT